MLTIKTSEFYKSSEFIVVNSSLRARKLRLIDNKTYASLQ